jgi:hypothetical protein
LRIPTAVVVFLLVSSSAHAAEDLFEDIRWSIFHEGCEAYPSGSNALKSAADLRECFLRMQAHNENASRAVRAASDEQILEATRKAIADIPKAFQLEENLRWVMDHEGQRGALRRLANQGDARTIRFTYRYFQKHNPNARNLLAALSDREVIQWVIRLDRGLPPDPAANPVTGRPDDPLVSFPFRTLGEPGLTALQRAALQATPPEKWIQKSATSSGPLREVVQQMYGTRNETFTAQLADIIQQVAGIPPFVSNGQQIRAPDLPVGSSALAPEIAQVIDLSAGRVSVRNLVSGESLPLEGARTAGTMVITGPSEVVEHLLGQLPGETNFRAYRGPTYETTTLIPQQDPQPGPCAPAVAPPPAAAPPVAQPASKYYVLDFFQKTTAEPCPHGQRVRDVIHQQLVRMHQPALEESVAPLEVDFFRHQQELKPYLDAFIARQDPLDQPALINAVKALQQRKLATVGKFEVPILYLQALYDHVLQDPSARVASSSFFTVGSQFSLLPKSLTANTKVLLLAAVADDAGTIEGYQLEPIRTFWSQRRNNGVLLVGALIGGKTQYGMYSQVGDGVSCVGDGDGWGDAKSCIQPTERGTSFATPAVATAVFAARHSLGSADLRTGAEWRDRVLRAVTIVPALTGQYCAPGVPNPAWLATGTPAVTFSGTMTQQVTVTNGRVSYASLDGKEETTTAFDQTHCAGIQTVAGRWYVFKAALGRWEEVVMKTVDVAVCSGGVERTLTLGDFTGNELKGVVYL